MRRALLVGSLVLSVALLTGCSTSTNASGAAASPPAAGQCNADAVQWAVGQDNTEEVGRRIWRESGAGLIRPIGPNQAVTMDYRADRVNVTIDKDNRITRVSCG